MSVINKFFHSKHPRRKKGQSSVEYIMMMFVIVTIAFTMKKIAGPNIESYMKVQAEQMAVNGRGGGFKDQKNYYYRSCSLAKQGNSLAGSCPQ